MKTAVSIPNDVFDEAESLVRRLGISRSELYAKAIAQMLADYRDLEITERLDQIYSEEESSLDPIDVQLQATGIAMEEW